jgi:hypothetical protein
MRHKTIIGEPGKRNNPKKDLSQREKATLTFSLLALTAGITHQNHSLVWKIMAAMSLTRWPISTMFHDATLYILRKIELWFISLAFITCSLSLVQGLE